MITPGEQRIFNKLDHQINITIDDLTTVANEGNFDLVFAVGTNDQIQYLLHHGLLPYQAYINWNDLQFAIASKLKKL